MKDLVKEFKKKLDKMSEKELDDLIQKCIKFKYGPTVDEYLEHVNNINNGIYVKEKDTIMKKIKENMTFSEALEHLKNGKCVRRANWHCNKFILKQVDANIPHTTIPNMQSLPQDGKKLIGNRDLEYRNQCLMVTLLETTAKATNYIPNWNDIFADDWQLVENEY